jgi:hypothetical protein
MKVLFFLLLIYSIVNSNESANAITINDHENNTSGIIEIKINNETHINQETIQEITKPIIQETKKHVQKPTRKPNRRTSQQTTQETTQETLALPSISEKTEPEQTLILLNDCNYNKIDDKMDILNNTSLDCNSNLIPDECEWNIPYQPTQCNKLCHNESECNNRGFCIYGKCYCIGKSNGTFCENENKCDGVICHNNGTCNEKTGICDCTIGYTGILCDSLDCGKHGIYDSITNMCQCMPGFTGKNCTECKLHPGKLTNRTHICCPTESKEKPFILLAVMNDKIFKYLGGLIHNKSCALPNTMTKHGVKLDCGCDIENVKVRSVSNRPIIYNLFDRFNVMSDPVLAGSIIDSADTLITQRRWNTECTGPTGNTNSAGVILLVVMSIVAALVLMSGIFLCLYSFGTNRKTQKAQDILQQKKGDSNQKPHTSLSMKRRQII